MEFLNGLEKSVYEQTKQEFGEEAALDVLWNWEEYIEQSEQYHYDKKENNELLEVYNTIKMDNMNTLKVIHINGEYFNNKESSYYSSRDGFLTFEDTKSRNIYKTNILYKEFKDFTEENLFEVAEMLLYINTLDEILMNEIKKVNSMYELYGMI